MTATQVPGYCTLCRSRCGTLNTVDGERLVRVDPDPSHPTGKAMCSKGRAAPEIAFSSRRLLTPKRRTRPKADPDPGWQDIGWDEAMAEVAVRLAAQRDAGGAESVAFAVTSPSGAPAMSVVKSFGDGFWSLITFSMQMAFIAITGYVIATSPPAARLIARLAAIPRTGPGAVAFIAFASMASSFVNWGISLVFSGLLARVMAARSVSAQPG